MSQSKESKFYVYALLDPRKEGPFNYTVGAYDVVFSHQPFYVGKGTHRRWRDHYTQFPGKNLHKEHLIQKLNSLGYRPLHYKIVEGVTEEEAFDIEELFISILGRIREGDGILLNISVGGRSGGGWAGWHHSEEFKQRQSINSRGRKHTDEAKVRISQERKGKATGSDNQWFGKPLPEHIKKKMSEAKKGKVASETHKENMFLARSLFVYYIETPNGEVIKVRRLQKFCDEVGMPIGSFRKTEQTKGRYKGYTILYKLPVQEDPDFGNPTGLKEKYAA